MTDKPRSFPSVPDFDVPLEGQVPRRRHDDIATRKAVAWVAAVLVLMSVLLLIGAAL